MLLLDDDTKIFFSLPLLIYLIIYFNVFTEIKIFKLIKNTVIFKIILSLIYFLFSFCGIQEYFILITVAIVVSIILSLITSKREEILNRFLILIFIFVFWFVINYLLAILMSSNILDIINMNILSLISATLYLDSNSNPLDKSSLNVEVESKSIPPTENKDYYTKPTIDTFKNQIKILTEAIEIEKNKSVNSDLQSPSKLIDTALKAEKINENEFNTLAKYLEKNNVKGFNENMPKFLNYLKTFNEILFLDGKIYLTEDYAKYMMTPSELLEAQKNPIFVNPDIKYPLPVETDVAKKPTTFKLFFNFNGKNNCSKIKFELTIPTEGEPDLKDNSLKTKYLFYSSLSDFIRNDLSEKMEIKNKEIVPFDKTKYAHQWKFFKDYFFIWFIELTIGSYLNQFLYFRDPLNELTPIKLLCSKYFQIYEYSEEDETLKKALIGLEQILRIKNTNLSELELIEGFKYWIQFWVRQVLNYNNNNMLKVEGFNHNMFNLDLVTEELFENILFVKSQILEGMWTINTMEKLLPLYGGINGLDTDDKIIEFYNKLFELYQIEIVDKYKETFDFRREYIVNRYSNIGEEELLKAYKWLEDKNKHIEFKSKLDKENFYKTIYPNPKKEN